MCRSHLRWSPPELAGWLAGGAVRRRHTSQSFHRTCTMWCSQISSPFISSQDFIICTLLYFIIAADPHHQQQQDTLSLPALPNRGGEISCFAGMGMGWPLSPFTSQSLA
ncbi:uncharacterized protein K489DRAFT_61621 [Dissoconium aciculare CBS 342.82]|uniref:Uncharacterized protein n=1 Tax=Dissoconium aciculare CBS 342.82 TaxID=1314786 RepID=A0A6J3LZ48_9PEZI|nr:uncharacterized protein K489DRAFT_61621 [Dissoconium aciculare CBS 342.82]KAF1819912.1 hypothetical protein K489DRAFT_61621 [Dissoconium aciculare CBS 342.82]